MGVWSEETLIAQIDAKRDGAGSDNPVIAMTIIAWPVFFPPLNPFELPAAFPTNETVVPLCSAKGRRGRILLASLRYHAGRTHGIEDTIQARLLGLKTQRVPSTSLRLGSQANRSLLAKLYGHRCAISGARVPVTQDAAHTRPLQYGGGNYLGNLMPLEANLHRLWDPGLISIDAQHRIMVSTQLQLFGSSDYLRYAGKPSVSACSASLTPMRPICAGIANTCLRGRSTSPEGLDDFTWPRSASPSSRAGGGDVAKP